MTFHNTALYNHLLKLKKMFFKFVYLSLCCCCCLVGVFGDEVKSVSVMEGGPVTLHIDITEIQSAYMILWRFGSPESLIARINREANKISIYDDVLDGRFRDRLQVNDQTGDLTITDITTNHTGVYEMTISGKQRTSYRFSVTVYANLPVPVIRRDPSQSSSSSSISNCSLLCSVLNVRDVSLSWYKGNGLLSSISVSDLNNISLHLECLDDSYSCVVNNPISNQTQHLNTDLCQTCSALTFIHKVVISSSVGFLMIAAVLIFCFCKEQRKTHQQVK
ncbi:uncharacterized protein [Misgurnus anguillicaudatus]|uniref:uncharacterized protein n=1 Tax=Misgurnus anguillicaudatus TaxID=75329 RepID=UPI003CCF7245